MKKIIICIVIFCAFAGLYLNTARAQSNLRIASTYPCVINKDHIKISGKTIVNIGQTFTYTADFFYPNETNAPIDWHVAGGTIVAQNTDPSVGAIFVTVFWDGARFDVFSLPSCLQSLSPASLFASLPFNAIGLVGITQGVVFNSSIYQGDVIPVCEAVGKKNNPPPCAYYPLKQKVNYLQTPLLLSGVENCLTSSSGAPNTYEWGYTTASATSLIAGALGAVLQPYPYTQDIFYVRYTSVPGQTINSPRLEIELNDFNAGTLFTDELELPYGGQPYIIDEMPYGGPCASNSYQHTWWISYDDEPWEIHSNTLHYNKILGGIKRESVRIRRSTTCNGITLYTNILEFTYANTIPKENQNYIKENTLLIKNIRSWYESELLPNGEKTQSITYFDGLARPMQKVAKEAATPDASGVWGDIVIPAVYNAFGQQTKGYLPYSTINDIGVFKTNALVEQSQYYQNNYNETSPFTETFVEASPVARPKQNKNSGTNWAASNGDQFNYDLNDVNEQVRIWNIGFLATDLPFIEGIYPSNELFKTEHLDEKNNKVIEYMDKSGNIILKKVQIATSPSIGHSGWLCTYSVYDDLGNMRFNITPKAVEYLDLNSWPSNMPPTLAKELCFGYFYDAKGRVVEKFTPQAGTIRYIYDTRDRVVLVQDETQNVTNKNWSFTLYDILNRTVATGLLKYNNSRIVVQNYVDGIVLANSTETISLSNTHNENLKVFGSITGALNAEYNSINYYDNYSFSGVQNFTNAHSIVPSPNPNVDPIIKSDRTFGMSTGSKTRVLNTGVRHLINTNYYDDEGRVIQALASNVIGGVDVITNQYDFADKILFTSSIHEAPATAQNKMEILTEHSFDLLGRIVTLSKNFNVGHQKRPIVVAEYSYDDMGRMKVKTLGPNPMSGGSKIESLEYSYNINGQLTGINKFYATKDPTRYNKWDNYFGLYLGYDNKDNAFAQAALNGNITGVIWNTQGDDRQRKFDYSYDAANQFVSANFTQKDNTSAGWANNKYDFSVGSNHASGKIKYDANGNILQMTQKGVLPNQSPFVIDDLRYTYASNGFSNKLLRVDDVSGNANNGILKDFKDGGSTVGSGLDYDYDDNGNLVLDKNKGIVNTTGGNGITYNYFNKVDEVIIANKGTTKYIYDASGEKLQKIFTPLLITGLPTITTTYINEYVYVSDGSHSVNARFGNLKYIHFEEGRLRIINEINLLPSRYLAPNVNLYNGELLGVLDYFITDHLGNTRMILTDELQSAEGLCTSELANAGIEEPQFGAVNPAGVVGSNNELVATRINVPNAWTTNTPNTKCVGLVNSGNKAIGPNVILKVMAGDIIEGYADYFYSTGIVPNATNNIVTPILNSLISSFNAPNVNGLLKNAGITTTNWNGVSNITSFINNLPNTGTIAAPRAYLNVLFFDEQFNLVGNAPPQRVTGNNMDYVQLQNEKCPTNGYAYIYLSNETNNMMVYFDNFKVTHVRGRIVEENHYYPFGLKIASISSSKLGDFENGHLNNNFGYQGANAEQDENTEWTEFPLRNYDAQIGRWTGVDPYDEFASGYVGMGNNPVCFIDPSGGNIITTLFSGASLSSMVAIGATVGFIAGGIYDLAKNDGDLKYAFTGALIGGSILFFTSSPLNVNIQYIPNWAQVIGDVKGKGSIDGDPNTKHGWFGSAYLAGYIRGIFNEIRSLGKIVTIKGDGFVIGDNYTNNKGVAKITEGKLTTKTLTYFRRHPRAKGIANAFTEYHSGDMGNGLNHGADNFTDKKFLELFNSESVFLYGNCINYYNALPTSIRLNKATVIGSFNWQLDLPFLLFGKFSGNDKLGSGISNTVPKLVNGIIPPLTTEFLMHRIAKNGKASDYRMTTKILPSGKITFKILSPQEARRINDIYHKQSTSFKAVIGLILNGF